ncbi:MAG TPA: hypothetical protein VKH44_11790 [Pirellulaceae bacterium]|nr:hypothetical protein [Pirellulaceae bacterium]
MLPKRAVSADSTDSTGYAARFNGYDEFVAAGLVGNGLGAVPRLHGSGFP